nr:indolepyruvate ferredoxin oxidoreductase subunit alpha [Desulfobulbaceae bacterium]
MARNNELWLSGNEAIALGAFEAGVKVASGYPGTPSTEILENLSKYEGVYTEWAPNEKVGIEVAIGSSFAGVRVLSTMKHVGMNVAADPLFTASYTGGRAGLVIINADDPEMHSSQNEQDNRNYAFAAKVPMLEPSDPAEAKEFVKLAFDISEEFDVPVIVRTTTRIAHVKGLVAEGEMLKSGVEPGIEKMPAKFVMLPGNARNRRKVIAERQQKLETFAETFAYNKIEMADVKIGIITSGISYLYVKEAFPEASVLKLGMVYPFPKLMISDFASKVDELFIVEELDPFIETHVKAMGIKCTGKEIVPAIGELNSFILKKAFQKESPALFSPEELPLRPPNMCAGCPHRGLFYSLKKLKVFVSGDIGCYTLGFLPPLSAMDSCVCMGASIGIAHGMEKALGLEAKGKVVAVLGDSTFFHSGLTGLVNVVYNKGCSTVVILDNRITGMTGHQHNPASGQTLMGEPTHSIDIKNLCHALGVKHVVEVNPHHLGETETALKEAIEFDGPSVVITKSPCVLLPEEKRRVKQPYTIDPKSCTGCKSCLRLGCPALNWVPVTEQQARELGFKEKQKGYTRISEMCNGCGQCAQLCKFEAITRAGEESA